MVLKFGFGPPSLGSVNIFSTALAYAGGSKDFKLNLTNAFLTGKSPGDTRFLRPNTITSHLNSCTLMSGISNGTPLLIY